MLGTVIDMIAYFALACASSPLLRTLLMNSLTSALQLLHQLISLKIPDKILGYCPRYSCTGCTFCLDRVCLGEQLFQTVLFYLDHQNHQQKILRATLLGRQTPMCTSWPWSWSGLMPRKGAPRRGLHLSSLKLVED